MHVGRVGQLGQPDSPPLAQSCGRGGAPLELTGCKTGIVGLYFNDDDDYNGGEDVRQGSKEAFPFLSVR